MLSSICYHGQLTAVLRLRPTGPQSSAPTTLITLTTLLLAVDSLQATPMAGDTPPTLITILGQRPGDTQEQGELSIRDSQEDTSPPSLDTIQDTPSTLPASCLSLLRRGRARVKNDSLQIILWIE